MSAMRDPACGQRVTERTARAVLEYGGERYLFCTRGCKMAFDREPELCLIEAGLEKRLEPSGITLWRCGQAGPTPT